MAYHIFKDDGTKETLDSLLAGQQRSTWLQSIINDWGRLSQGNDPGTVNTNTIMFISRHEVPNDKKVAYATMDCNYRPLKEEKLRVRIIVGGDRLPYHLDVGFLAVDFLETKLMLNSVISDSIKGA